MGPFPGPLPQNMRTQKWVLLATLFLGFSNKRRTREIHFAEQVLGARVARCESRFGDQIRVYEICNFDGVESSGVHVFHWAQGLLRRIPVSDDWKLCTPQGGGAFAACLQSMCDARARCVGAAFDPNILRTAKRSRKQGLATVIIYTYIYIYIWVHALRSTRIIVLFSSSLQACLLILAGDAIWISNHLDRD